MYIKTLVITIIMIIIIIIWGGPVLAAGRLDLAAVLGRQLYCFAVWFILSLSLSLYIYIHMYISRERER